MTDLIVMIGERNAGQYLALLGMAVVLSYLGLFTVLRRIVFTGVALTQLAAAGVATSFFVADSAFIPLAVRQFAATYGSVLGSLGMSVAGAFGLAVRGRMKRLSPDAFVGIIFVAASALAVLMVWKSARGLAELRDILAGEVLLSRPDELFLLWLGLVTVAIVHAKNRREFWLVSFDPEFARSLGQPLGRLELLFLGTLAVTIALSLRAAGLMLVFSFLLLPPLTGLNLAARLGPAGLMAAAAGAGASLVGFLAAFRFNLPVAPCIVAVSVAMHLASLLARWSILRWLLVALVTASALAALVVAVIVFPLPGQQPAGMGGGDGHNHGVVTKSTGPTRDQLLQSGLTRLAGEAASEARAQAARDLEELGDSRATETLARALMDEDAGVRAAVGAALRAIAAQYQPPRTLRQMRESEDPETRLVAALAQTEIGEKAGIEGLIACVEDPAVPPIALDDLVLPRLRALADHAFPFDAFAEDEERARAVTTIKAWWQTEGPTFRFPPVSR